MGASPFFYLWPAPSSSPTSLRPSSPWAAYPARPSPPLCFSVRAQSLHADAPTPLRSTAQRPSLLLAGEQQLPHGLIKLCPIEFSERLSGRDIDASKVHEELLDPSHAADLRGYVLQVPFIELDRADRREYLL